MDWEWTEGFFSKHQHSDFSWSNITLGDCVQGYPIGRYEFPDRQMSSESFSQPQGAEQTTFNRIWEWLELRAGKLRRMYDTGTQEMEERWWGQDGRVPGHTDAAVPRSV